MNKINRKLKILINAWSAYAAHTTNHNTHLLTAQKQETHKRAYLLENRGLGKTIQENGPKADKDKTERATGLGRRTTKDEI